MYEKEGEIGEDWGERETRTERYIEMQADRQIDRTAGRQTE